LPDPAAGQGDDGVRAALAQQPWAQTGHLSLRGVGADALGVLPGSTLRILSELRGLDLSGNGLTGPPAWLELLPGVEELDLSGNRIAELTGVGFAAGLRALDLSENRITALPEGWARCGRLRWLSLTGNRIDELTALAELPAIEVLDVARNRVRSLNGLPGAATLRSLDASSNLVAELPTELAAFQALRRLDLSRNRLTGTQLEVLSDLPLTELFLDWNRIERLPQALGRRQFRRFTLTGNPVLAPLVTQSPPAPGPPPARPADPADPAVVAAAATYVAVRAFVQRNIVGGYEPGKRYFGPPESRFGFRIGASDDQDAYQLIDMYYKRYPDVLAEMRLGDGTRAALTGLTRRAALALISGRREGRPGADIQLMAIDRPGEVDAGVAFAVESVTRLPNVSLYPNAGDDLGVHQPAAPRVVNVWVADEGGVPLPAATVLAPSTGYLVQLSMGAEVDETVVLNPVPLPLAELEPSSSGGWWFDVVVASADVDVSSIAHRMFLPFNGPGWVCPCLGEEHTCVPRERSPYLDVPFSTRHPRESRRAEAGLRCTVYHRNNAVQSIRVGFTVSDREGSDGEGGPAVRPATLIHGVVDYALAENLGQAAELPPRRLNVLSNETGSGTHTIVVKGAGAPPLTVHLTESAVTDVLRAVRAELTLLTLGVDGKTPRYDGDNVAPPGQLRSDLETLAYLGSRFWQDAVPVGVFQDELRPLVRDSVIIQIARVTETVFPWALIYDYPHLLDDPWEPCELVTLSPRALAALAQYPDNCPFAAEHRLNTLCPFGFWGFRHQIEQPPSVIRGRLCTQLPVPHGAHAATVRSLRLDETLSATHLQRLGEYLTPRFDITDCDSRDDFVAAIDTPALPLIYFYCHGRIAKLGHAGVDLLTPYLEIGQDERLGTGDLNAWAAVGQWHREYWQRVPPLVFINGCDTAALSPEQVVTFVNAFAGAEAAGVIGTEIAVAQPVASEFAQRFYQHLMAGPEVPVGRALRRARLDMLAKGNLAGLVYTAFCSADLALSPGS
jgi:hypothetical protein